MENFIEKLLQRKNELEPNERAAKTRNGDKDDFKDRLNAYVAQRVKEERVGRHYTQDDIAKAVGMTRTSLTNFERGMQSLPIHKLYLIAYMLNIRMNDLFPTSLYDLMESTESE